MNQKQEEDIETVSSAVSDQRGKRVFETNMPEFSGKDTVRYEGSSKPVTKTPKFRYTGKDINRVANLASTVLLPLELTPETIIPTIAAKIAIKEGGKYLGKKLDAHNAAVDAARAANTPHPFESGHIAPHITGPEPAILPPKLDIKLPIPIRPLGK